ncbi:hypothetical protein GJAV_G00072060 [Gymnothorax javanicus]|nr:hypothetical protein GJAV_G00072060 [Gymnothorax javanicus]
MTAAQMEKAWMSAILMMMRQHVTKLGANTSAFAGRGESEVFACSERPFLHIEGKKLHQLIKRVHPENHERILGYVGNGAEDPPSPSGSHQHPTPPKTFPTPTPPKSMDCAHLWCDFCTESRLNTSKRWFMGKGEITPTTPTSGSPVKG